MLILTRRIGETLVIGENIVVRVVSVGENQARIGIDAPRDVRVDRLEIRERMQRERQACGEEALLAQVAEEPAPYGRGA